MQLEISGEILALSSEFIYAKQLQWEAFKRRLNMENIPQNLGEIIKEISKFLNPVINSILSKTKYPAKWIAPGPWI